MLSRKIGVLLLVRCHCPAIRPPALSLILTYILIILPHIPYPLAYIVHSKSLSKLEAVLNIF
jgi:hypothetical protein